MLKNIIGFTSQEREELNDKKDFLKKMIMDYCGPKFMLTEICSLRNYWVNRDNINEMNIDAEYGWGQDCDLPVYIFPHLKEYIKLEMELNYNIEHSLFVPVHEGFMVIDTDRLRYNWNIEVKVDELDMGKFIGSGGVNIEYVKNYINRSLSDRGSKIICKKITALKIEN